MDMTWKSRKPTRQWVRVAGVLLFLLAVAAPRGWQRYQAPAPLQDEPSAAANGMAQQQQLFSIPPNHELATASIHPTMPSVLPLISSDGYDEFAGNPAIDYLASMPLDTEFVAQDASPPMLREFNLESLLTMRDALASLADRALEVKLDSPQSLHLEPSHNSSSLRVKVSSSDDRLAMLDQGDRQQDRVVDPAEPENQFAQDLLYPRSPQRLAMRTPTPSITITPTPTPTKSPEPPPVELVEEPLLAAPIRHIPQVLIQQLEILGNESAAAAWAEQVHSHIRRFTQRVRQSEAASGLWPAQQQTLAELQALAEEGLRSALETTDPSLQYDWLQASQGLDRRLDVWSALLNPAVADAVRRANAQTAESTDLQRGLEAAATWTAGSQQGTAWREYLLLDRVARAAEVDTNVSAKQRHHLAQVVLGRMEDTQLSTEQRLFLATESLDLLRTGLRPWATGSVKLDTLLALIERYEVSCETRYADAISEYQQRLRWSSEHRLKSLADHLDEHYRGANMRVAITGELLNRMMPSQRTRVTPVRGKIAGTKVHGKSKTSTQLRVHLLPDNQMWRFGLEAYGTVVSQTASDTWPARVRNKASLNFQALKQIVISPEGVQVAPTRVDAQGRTKLVGVESQFDPIPLLGTWLRKIARNRHAESKSVAMRQVKSKVTREVRQQMDRQADPKLHNLEIRFREKVLGPFEQLAVVAEPLQMRTTEQRAVMRLRMANGGQLAAHTPRPSAPSDSLMSVQLHDSALNNAVRGLGLDGRRMTLGELFEFFSTRLGRSGVQPPDDLPLKAVVEFAANDAVRIRCDDDRFELLLSIDTLSYGRDKIENFQVHAFFRPELNGMQVTFVRDGTLQFSGRRLRTGPRVVLHSVFGKLLRKEHQLALLGGGLREDARFSGLMITQLVLEDGWLAVALGPAYPQRVAWRAVGGDVAVSTITR